MNLAPQYEFRDKLLTRLKADLLGPRNGTVEVIDDPPATAYIAGVLFPKPVDKDVVVEAASELEDDTTSATLKAEDTFEHGVGLAHRPRPSAMGITFAVDTNVTTVLAITVAAAVYEPINHRGEIVVAERAAGRETGEVDYRWRRKELELSPVHLDVTTAPPQRTQLAEGLDLRVRVRKPENGTVSVTVALVNANVYDPRLMVDAACYFQPSINVDTGDQPGLVERPTFAGANDQDLELTRLLYRHAPGFATGHGCAAAWDWQRPPARGERSAEVPRTEKVRTTFVPSSDVPVAESNPQIGTVSMLRLARASAPSIAEMLRPISRGYAEWIDERKTEIENLGDRDLIRVANEQMEACESACRRVESGIGLLESDPDVATAFQLANRAMALQRARAEWIKNGRAGEPDESTPEWRPFQLGFILTCLDGIVQPDHPDRHVADLLWFPTGGGKTEAYLGLIAFTAFLRRLRGGSAGAGVTALMRYTLRLLTLQQFDRATTLICAMEMVRREDERLGEEEFSIGMWVGRAATPNNLDSAQQSIRKLRNGQTLQEQNPVQLKFCPWCGVEMSAYDYEIPRDVVAMEICCPNAECEFTHGLPVHVVDETIYESRPTLIIATVDKFAQIAWNENVAKLFNREGAPSGTPPPDLIIQDELHLISGPLGTLTGLYETAIDTAAGGPKVIASTATIRRASTQGRRLFARDVRQFPPAGLDARDSWFAVEAPPDRKATRTYVGLFSTSTSQSTLLIRSYAALLHDALNAQGTDTMRDPYWTLVGYFNSLRVLASAELQVNDDVTERLRALAARSSEGGRDLHRVSKLTSRVDSSEIPSRLKELEISYPDAQAVDVVLATNMISVGLDVNRLGLMFVSGQPQTTAEYIQSTSRVGRQHPGFIGVLLNSARSRDRSHFENFATFHAALYRQVESTSVTPFAPRARDRGLHAVLVGLARLMLAHARTNDRAACVDEFLDELNQLKELILQRVSDISEAQGRSSVDVEAARQELDEFIEHWRKLAADNHDLVYEAPGRRSGPRADGTALLRRHQDDDLERAVETMTSLRDVDVETALYLER